MVQEGTTQHLDLCIWFDELEIRDPHGSPIALESLIAGGKRWWDAMHAGDSRTQGHGIVPLKPPADD